VRRWILVTSGKGGVGKSLVARLLAEMKREVEPTTWLLDGDGEVGQLAQYLGTRDELDRVVRGQRGDAGVDTFALHGWRDDSGMRDVIEGLIGPLRTAQADVLVDLPAASLSVLAALERETDSLPRRHVWDSGRPSSSRSRRWSRRVCQSPTLSSSGPDTTLLPCARNSGAMTAITGVGFARNFALNFLSAEAAKSSSRGCAAGSSSISMRIIFRSPPRSGQASSTIPTTRCSHAGLPRPGRL